MANLYLIRHGRAAAGWDTAIDPPLDEHGRAQAAATALRLNEQLSSSLRRSGAVDVVTSPLLRCQETAAAFATASGCVVRIEPRIAEIPSPVGVAVADRVTWLRRAMQSTWAELIASDGRAYHDFRDALLDWATSIRVDTVAFSHFVAINAIIGVALNDDRLVIRSLDNASITHIEVGDDGSLTLREGGREADTLIR